MLRLAIVVLAATCATSELSRAAPRSSRRTTVEYDLPSSLFSQFSNAALTRGAKQLDDKLAALVEHSLH